MLQARIASALPGVPVRRNVDTLERATKQGVVTLIDGSIDLVEQTLSVVAYSWQASLIVECAVADPDADSRTATLDRLRRAVLAAVDQDDGLDARVDGVAIGGISREHAGQEGAPGLGVCSIELNLTYDTDSLEA